MPKTLTVRNCDDRPWPKTGQQFNDLNFTVVLNRLPQRGVIVSVRGVQKAWSRQGLDQRTRPVVADGGYQRLELLLFGVHCPARAARVSVRSGEGEREERRR